MLTLSKQGMFELLCEEGIVPAPYLDSGSVWTWGAGHTAHAGHPDPADMSKGIPAEDKIEAIFANIFSIFLDDIAEFENEVRDAVTVDLEQHEFDALVLFHYNTGAIARASGTKELNAGNKKEAARRYRLYNKVNGKKLNALAKRRGRESKLLLDGAYSGTEIAVHGVTDANTPTRTPVRVMSYHEFLGYLEGEQDETEGDIQNPGGLLHADKTDPSVESDLPEPDTNPPGTIMLKSGDKGVKVKSLQTRLHELGYGLRKSDIDGVFGKQTRMGVVSWQVAADLPVTGTLTESDFVTLLSTEIYKPTPLHRRENGTVDKEMKNDKMAKDAKTSMKVGTGVAVGGTALGVADVSGVVKSLGTSNVGMFLHFLEDNAWLLAIIVGLIAIWLARRQVAAWVDRYHDGH